MSRFLHTASMFGFGASSGVALAIVHPWPAAAAFAVVGLLICIVLQMTRESDIAREAASPARSGR